MPRFSNPVTQFFDNSGTILSGGKLKFTSAGSDTLKDTYTSAAMSSANANPVVLDSAGRAGNIYLSGTYRVSLLDSDDVQIWQRDPVGEDSVDMPWGTWSNGTTYAIGDIARASNNAYYRSLTASNTSNDPTTSPVQWEQINLIAEWNTNRTYSSGDIVSYSGKFYRSTAGSNSGNTPTGKTNWAIAVEEPVAGTVTLLNQTTSFAVTGVGFKPRLVEMHAVSQSSSGNTYVASSSGYSTGGSSNSHCTWTRVDGANHQAGLKAGSTWFLTNNAVSVESSGFISSMDSDGFTIQPSSFTNVVGYATWIAYP